MRRVVLPAAFLLLIGVWRFTPMPGQAARTEAPVQLDEVSFSTVVDWQGGMREGLLISNNADGELRLDKEQIKGRFTSGLTKADFPFNAVGAVWQAEVPKGTDLVLQVRGGPTAESLGDWHLLTSGDARSQADDGAFALESVVSFPTDTLFLQLRVAFNAATPNASPVLDEIKLTYINTTAGPAPSPGLPRVPAFFGSATLTPPPAIVLRETWGAVPPSAQIARQRPRGVVLHQIGGAGIENPLMFLRALATYDTNVLGWDDLPFHFVVDANGTIYEGRAGGPTSAVARLAGGDVAVHIALIGTAALTSQQQESLTSLLAWLGQAYDIPPLGQHSVETSGAGTVTRPNIVAHAEIVPDVAGQDPALRELVGQLRQRADQQTIRARWYFAEGNVLNYAERLSVLNPSMQPAQVRFRLLRQPGPAVVRETTIAPGGRVDLVLNTIFSDTTDVPAIVEANHEVVAERFMDFGTDISSGLGVNRPARVWYFAEGSTDGDYKTFLLLFNPQVESVAATITYMKGDGTTAEQRVTIPPGQRSVVSVSDRLPGVGFGARVIATQPIVAERTMIFGAGSTLQRGGLHTSPGVVALSRHWYFAEGTTQAPFQMWVLVLNPNAQPAVVSVSFLTPDGTSLTRRYEIPPTTRLAINVNEVVPDLGVATTIESDRPIAAERAMYWQANSLGTVTAGATAPAYTWIFADGRTSGDFQEYLLLSNPAKNQARVSVEFIQADGKRGLQTIVMPGGSRYTMAVHQLYPGQTAIAALVRSTQPIVAERALYPGAPGTETNRGGATTLGMPEVGR